MLLKLIHLVLFAFSSVLVYAQNDTSPPVLINFEASETCIDVSNNSVDVSFTVEATDNSSGINQVLVLAFSPNGGAKVAFLTLTSGTALNGVYEGTITFDVSDLDGIHTFYLDIGDVVGNEVEYDENDILNFGFQESLKIINTNSDSTPPVLVDFQVSETCIDVTNTSVDVVFTVEATDNLIGIEQVLVLAFAPNNSVKNVFLNLISGTPQNGIFQGTMTFDNSDLAGVHTFYLDIEDFSNNEIELDDQALLNLGFQESIKIIGTNSDTNPPELVNFTASETCIDVANNSVDVTFTIEATDDLSGIDQVIVLAITPTNNAKVSFLNLISGTPQNGVYEGIITFSNTDLEGIYPFYVDIEDDAGNSNELNETDLFNLGFQNNLSMSNQICCFRTSLNTIQLSNSNHGLVYRQAGNSCYRVTVNNDGSLSHSSFTCNTGPSDLNLSCGSLYISSLNPRLVLKSPNTNCWELIIDALGNVTTQATSCSTPVENEIIKGDIFFDNINLNPGVILRTSVNDCVKLKLDDFNQVHAETTCCPN